MDENRADAGGGRGGDGDGGGGVSSGEARLFVAVCATVAACSLITGVVVDSVDVGHQQHLGQPARNPPPPSPCYTTRADLLVHAR